MTYIAALLKCYYIKLKTNKLVWIMNSWILRQLRTVNSCRWNNIREHFATQTQPQWTKCTADIVQHYFFRVCLVEFW